jgi:outer membrane protein
MPSRTSAVRCACWVLLPLLGVVAPITAQAISPWAFRSRLVLSGSTEESEPVGYTMYSGVALEAAVARRLSAAFGVEISLRTESREIDRAGAGSTRERLGSLELLPVNLLVQWCPNRSGSVRPYLGAGLNLTVAWEKSGALDSLDVRPHLGGALQLGALFPLSSRVALNTDLRWNTLETDIQGSLGRLALLKVHPIALGLGVELAF